MADADNRRMMNLDVLLAQIVVKLDDSKLCALGSGLIILGLDPIFG